MHVISHLQGWVSTSLIYDEFWPETGAPRPSLEQALISRYHFQARMQVQQIDSNTIFSPCVNGELIKDDNALPILMFEMLRDRINVSSNTTDQAEYITADIIDFLKTKFNFRSPNLPSKKLHSSTIVVDFGFDFDLVFERWANLFRVLQTLVEKDHPGLEIGPFAIRGMGHFDGQWANQELQGYSLEKRVTSAQNRKWQWSQAPLSTSTHIEFLRTVEKAFL